MEKPDLQDLALQYFFYVLFRLRQATSAQVAEDLRPLWRDYSYWNGLINGAVAAAHGVLGAFGRAGISWGYIDPTFAHFWSEFGKYSLYRSSYHVIYTDQSIIDQADKVWYVAQPEREIIPRMIESQCKTEIIYLEFVNS